MTLVFMFFLQMIKMIEPFYAVVLKDLESHLDSTYVLTIIQWFRYNHSSIFDENELSNNSCRPKSTNT